MGMMRVVTKADGWVDVRAVCLAAGMVCERVERRAVAMAGVTAALMVAW